MTAIVKNKFILILALAATVGFCSPRSEKRGSIRVVFRASFWNPIQRELIYFGPVLPATKSGDQDRAGRPADYHTRRPPNRVELLFPPNSSPAGVVTGNCPTGYPTSIRYFEDGYLQREEQILRLDSSNQRQAGPGWAVVTYRNQQKIRRLSLWFYPEESRLDEVLEAVEGNKAPREVSRVWFYQNSGESALDSPARKSREVRVFRKGVLDTVRRYRYQPRTGKLLQVQESQPGTGREKVHSGENWVSRTVPPGWRKNLLENGVLERPGEARAKNRANKNCPYYRLRFSPPG